MSDLKKACAALLVLYSVEEKALLVIVSYTTPPSSSRHTPLSVFILPLLIVHRLKRIYNLFRGVVAHLKKLLMYSLEWITVS